MTRVQRLSALYVEGAPAPDDEHVGAGVLAVTVAVERVLASSTTGGQLIRGCLQTGVGRATASRCPPQDARRTASAPRR